MRILIAGGSGLVGTAVKEELGRLGHEVRCLVRSAPRNDSDWQWDPAAGSVPSEAIDWADSLIGLSGASLSRLPWTRRYRGQILGSRVEATRTLAKAIDGSANPPRVWVNASAVGYYGNRPGEILDGSAGRGSGFLAEVVHQWEDAATVSGKSRVVKVRTGIVVASRGAFRPLILATRLGLGSRIGSGTQYWPWISLRDEARAIVHLATESKISGPVNLVGPNPATSVECTRALAAALHRPHWLWLPNWLLRLVMGPAADELLLADQQVVPMLLESKGFKFEHSTVDSAITAMLEPN
ncbi:MAG: TIGR01777 family oxidoreductase [Microbacteriaceae bacterium]|nr:TIGR01777 family oxidoreductase [Microbacteriaceae bacterium]